MKLKPCPFCGEKGLLKKENNGFGSPFIYRTGCKTLDCRGRYPAATGEHTEKESIDRWNQRVKERDDE